MTTLNQELRLSSNLIAMQDGTSSSLNIHEPNITANELRQFPKSQPKSPNSKRDTNKSHLKAHSRRDALGSSTTISTAVAGATSLLQSVISKESRYSPRNSNVNIGKSENDKKRFLTQSTSDQAFKYIAKRTHKKLDKEKESDEEIKMKLF